jgi:hypothetical protein
LLVFEIGQQEIFDKEGTKINFKFDLVLIIYIFFRPHNFKKPYLAFVVLHCLDQIIYKNLT